MPDPHPVCTTLGLPATPSHQIWSSEIETDPGHEKKKKNVSTCFLLRATGVCSALTKNIISTTSLWVGGLEKLSYDSSSTVFVFDMGLYDSVFFKRHQINHKQPHLMEQSINDYNYMGCGTNNNMIK